MRRVWLGCTARVAVLTTAAASRGMRSSVAVRAIVSGLTSITSERHLVPLAPPCEATPGKSSGEGGAISATTVGATVIFCRLALESMYLRLKSEGYEEPRLAVRQPEGAIG
jgi:hypothetical protein